MMSFRATVGRILNFLLLIIAFYIFGQRVPSIYHHFRVEETVAPAFEVRNLDGDPVSLFPISQPRIVVFWATWCGPCEVELGRLNTLVSELKIPKESVIAISSFEQTELVKRIVRDRKYEFQVALDPNGQIANLYQVQGTPTVVFINKDGIIKWMTTGLSPLLSQRARNLFK